MNNFEKETELTLAIHANDYTKVIELLKQDKNPNVPVLYKNNIATSLFIAIDKGFTHIAKILIESPNTKINEGCIHEVKFGVIKENSFISPLYWAIKQRNIEIVKLLVAKKDIDINKGKKNLFQTPLDLTIGIDNNEILAILLSSPDINLENTDYSGHHAINYAIHRKNIDAVEMMLNMKVSNTKEKGNWEGKMLLFFCSNGYTQYITRILEYPTINVNYTNEFGETAFYTACLKGNLSIVKILLSDKRIDINLPNNSGETPFYIACKSGHFEIVYHLLSIKSINKDIALEHAKKNGFESIINRLLLAKTEKERTLLRVEYYSRTNNLNIRSEKLKENIFILREPIGSILEITSIDDIPNTFPEVESILIHSIGIKILPALPTSLLYLNCSNNPISVLPELPNTLQVLICMNCNLSELPSLPDSMEYLDARDNKLYDIPKLPPKLYLTPIGKVSSPNIQFHSTNLLLSGNRLPYGFINGYGSITIYSKKHIFRTLHYKDDAINTMILPKGTLLFRDSVYPYKKEELLGVPLKDGTHHMYPEFNVFFYPYPFVSELFIDTKYIHVFKLRRDIEVVMGVAPSQNTRYDRIRSEYLTSCSYISTGLKNIMGRNYDPCFVKEFSSQHPTLNGFFGIADSDARKMLSNEYSQRFWSKYRTNHTDMRFKFTNTNYSNNGDTFGNILHSSSDPGIGLAELILHPHKNRFDYTSEYNYEYVQTMKRIPYQYDESWNTVETNLGENGSWTIDLHTKMYVDYNSVSDEVKARCVPIEEPYKLHYLNYTYWKVGGEKKQKSKPNYTYRNSRHLNNKKTRHVRKR